MYMRSEELQENGRCRARGHLPQRRHGGILEALLVPSPIALRKQRQANRQAEEDLCQAGVADGNCHRQVKEHGDSTQDCLGENRHNPNAPSLLTQRGGSLLHSHETSTIVRIDTVPAIMR